MRGLHLEEKLTLKVKDVDVIVLDYMLPDINGVETLKEIRKINRKIPISSERNYLDNNETKRLLKEIESK